jgi:hypothetical protein
MYQMDIVFLFFIGVLWYQSIKRLSHGIKLAKSSAVRWECLLIHEVSIFFFIALQMCYFNKLINVTMHAHAVLLWKATKCVYFGGVLPGSGPRGLWKHSGHSPNGTGGLVVRGLCSPRGSPKVLVHLSAQHPILRRYLNLLYSVGAGGGGEAML